MLLYTSQDLILIMGAFSGTALAIIGAIFAGLVSLRTANKVTDVGAKVAAVDTKLTVRNGGTVGQQIDDLTTTAALATAPEERTATQVKHLEAAAEDPATDASQAAPLFTPPPRG